MSKRRKPRQIGKWTLLKWCREGGNAIVYQASDGEGDQYALKLLKDQRPGREPYLRFEREISVLRELTASGEPGVVPLLDSSPPGATGEPGAAYYVMPLLRPIRKALHGKPPEDVIRAVIGVARVLARLHKREPPMAHRDIKPENLFVDPEGTVLIGDFGLVTHAERTALTVPGAKIGPVHYIAPEALSAEADADWHAADVYSLAKTLWVLLTGQRYPLPGPHWTYPERSAAVYSVGRYTVLPKTLVTELDSLLERATDIDPARRPSASEFADELDLMTRTTSSRPHQPGDLSGLKEQAKAFALRSKQKVDARAARAQESSARLQRLQDALEPALEQLRQELADGLPGFTIAIDDRPFSGSHQSSGREYKGQSLRAVVVRPQGADTSPFLSAGHWVALSGDGFAYVAMHYGLGRGDTSPYAPPGPFSGLWEEHAEFPCDSSQQRMAISELAAKWRSHLDDAVQAFSDFLRSDGTGLREPR